MESTALNIEEAAPGPFGAPLRGLAVEACREGFVWMKNLEPEWTERPFDRLGEGLFLARLDDRLVGVAAISEDPHLRDGATGRLRFIYVSPHARGRGVADALVARCLAQAGDRWSVIRLHTDNPAAARLYARRGFTALPKPDAQATHAWTPL